MVRLIIIVLFLISTYAQAEVEFFSPQGEVKNVRQVTARFAEQMVPFGDPRLSDPFDIQCSEKGQGRWIDGRNWSFDFEENLPAGVECIFTLKKDLKTLAGKSITGSTTYSFTTGGPAIIHAYPYEGSPVDENQIFLLGLDAPATEQSMLQHARCSADGIAEDIPIKIIKGETRTAILKNRKDFMDGYIYVLFKNSRRAVISARSLMRGSDREKFLKKTDPSKLPIAVVQCTRTLPNDASVKLIWGQGVTSISGVKTSSDQTKAYNVRPEFLATFSCQRANPDADCVPIMPMVLEFTSPVAAKELKKITLKDAQGKIYKPAKNNKEEFPDQIRFAGPFPELTSFQIALPAQLKDDGGRSLSNRDRFPLTVKTDEYPPLVKFPAAFGIIEAKGDGLLPVTVRNVEPEIAASLYPSEEGKQQGLAKGEVHRVDSKSIVDIVGWLAQVNKTERFDVEYNEETKKPIIKNHSSAQSIFTEKDVKKAFTLPKPNGARAFEVIGIPLKKPGFYVVELASPKLGASLITDNRTYHVRTTALVTNLAAHLKLGRESSLVWVTTLDQGKPVPNAHITVADCAGQIYWQGKTDTQGRAQIKESLPDKYMLPNCLRQYHNEFFIMARQGDDMTFTFSDWNKGIDPWRFNLPQVVQDNPYLTATVFDRSLFRAGETVHMKHFYRKHMSRGFAFVDKDALKDKVIIRHVGSDQKYEVDVNWSALSTAESSWTIPKDAKQGIYQVLFTDTLDSRGRRKKRSANNLERVSGSFRVEAYRVPSMRAVMTPQKLPLIDASSVDIDLQINYLSGGGASNAPVKLRGLVQPKFVGFADYEGFTFSNGNVVEGIVKEQQRDWYHRGYELDDNGYEIDSEGNSSKNKSLRTQNITLDNRGGARVNVSPLPKSDTPQDVLAELEYRDPNGELLTAATRVALWPSAVVVGLKPDSWAASKDNLKFHAIALDVQGKPMVGVNIKVDLFQNIYFSHRKRLVGGFYAFEHRNEIKRIGSACEGKTDDKGLLICTAKTKLSGNFILRAQAQDANGRSSYANQQVWVAGSEEWWYEVSDNDRMDVLPEKKRYEPGDTAVFQVRMPFKQATALVTIEREGIIDSFITPISRKEPIIRVPLKSYYAPNVFVSVLVVRGRAAGFTPTATVDLGRPSFKLGIAEILVGWRAHELKVKVSTDRDTYKVREQVDVDVEVTRADGNVLSKGAEIALAAVDEGLLELANNDSWKLLETMMQRRGIEVLTATAQMQVVGKRHYGRKALPAGGGGGTSASAGKRNTRELFDTLLFWKARVELDEHGKARIKVPLNDSLTSFRIVAVANASSDLFGTGATSVRTTQDLMLFSGLPPLVREQDNFKAGFTVRNASDRVLNVELSGNVLQHVTQSEPKSMRLNAQSLTLAASESKEIFWMTTVPVNVEKMDWEISAREYSTQTEETTLDKIKVSQKVIAAVPVRTFQATLLQLEKPLNMTVALPSDAIPGRGGINVLLRDKLADELAGVKEYMKLYDYTCFEQRASQAVALRDKNWWDNVMAGLPSYLDNDGLVKYFPLMREGSDALTAYLLAIAHEAEWQIPAESRERMLQGLTGFVEGRVIRHSALATADVAIRKIAALEAVSRYRPQLPAKLFESFTIEPNLWPTSAVLDLYLTAQRVAAMPERDKHTQQAEQILRSRLNFQGTTMGFSTERTDALWWLMISGDVNANRVLLAFLEQSNWKEDVPRLVRGTLGRHRKGHWNTTVANAWGVLAIEKFSKEFESTPVTGVTASALASTKKQHDWSKTPKGSTELFPWPTGASALNVNHEGAGKPWLTVQSLAAIPLKQPFSSGYKIIRTIKAVEQKTPNGWSRGDVVRVRLELEAQSDMTWVVVNDPIPAGAAILGTGLGKDSQILTQSEKKQGWVWPAFEERRFDSFRAYYEFVPKGTWTVEYTMRLNNEGEFLLPATRVEAMYSPEMFGEIPNQKMKVMP